MSYLTDTDFNKRAANLFVAFENAVAQPGITIAAEQADMTYFATYVADVPDVVAIGGVYDPALTGSNFTLEDADTRVVIAGQGTAAGTVNNTTDNVACEFVIGGGTQASAVGLFIAGLSPPYDPEEFAGGSGQNPGFESFSSYYLASGDAYGFVGGSGGNQPYVPGDIVGVVTGNGTRFYINGVFITSVNSSNSNYRPMVTALPTP